MDSTPELTISGTYWSFLRWADCNLLISREMSKRGGKACWVLCANIELLTNATRWWKDRHRDAGDLSGLEEHTAWDLTQTWWVPFRMDLCSFFTCTTLQWFNATIWGFILVFVNHWCFLSVISQSITEGGLGWFIRFKLIIYLRNMISYLNMWYRDMRFWVHFFLFKHCL